MGFLDHSTNNIIIDAVLTDRGRELLATQGAAFSITRFCLADDEIDYTLIQKFGRTVGREKIIKNTPIFEAQTHRQLAIKNKLKTLVIPTKRFMPTFKITGNGFNETDKVVQVFHHMTNPQLSARNLTVELSKTGNESILPELQDVTLNVICNPKLLGVVAGGTQIAANTITDNLASHPVQVGSDVTLTEAGGALVNFTITANKDLPSETFALFSDPSNPNRIVTVLSVEGISSGFREDISVIIDKPDS